MGDDLGEVGRGGVRMGGAEEGEEAEGLAAGDGGSLPGIGVGKGGRIVEEGVEEHGDAVTGEGSDDLLEVIDGDLVGVAVGELGEGGEDPGLELHHGQMRRKGR